jgi:hypothetical protein
VTKEHLFEVLTRVGFAARGLLYLAISALVIILGEAAGAEGALRLLSDGLGRWILIVVAVGFAAYGLWRLADTAFGTEHPGDGRRAMGQRVGAGLSGAVHLFLAYQTMKLAAGAARASSNPDQTAQAVLSLPAGWLLLGAAGVGVAIAGFVELNRALSCSFLRDLVPEARESSVKWLGRLGYLARGAVFLVVAYFLCDAALAGASSKAGGTEQVFSWLSRPVALGLAAGLGLFGVYALTEAWYRRIHAPDLDALAERARQRTA